VTFVDGNDVVKQLTTATLNPSFRDTVLPGTFERGSNRDDLEGSNCPRDLCSILAIKIKEEKPGS